MQNWLTFSGGVGAGLATGLVKMQNWLTFSGSVGAGLATGLVKMQNRSTKPAPTTIDHSQNIEG